MNHIIFIHILDALSMSINENKFTTLVKINFCIAQNKWKKLLAP